MRRSVAPSGAPSSRHSVSLGVLAPLPASAAIDDGAAAASVAPSTRPMENEAAAPSCVAGVAFTAGCCGVACAAPAPAPAPAPTAAPSAAPTATAPTAALPPLLPSPSCCSSSACSACSCSSSSRRSCSSRRCCSRAHCTWLSGASSVARSAAAPLRVAGESARWIAHGSATS